MHRGIEHVKTNTARIAALAASAALGLTACGGDTRAADAKVTTPARPVASRTPSPATNKTTPPWPSPAQASQETAAIALVRTYVAVYNKALQSGSTTAFRDTFKETCALCLGDASRIDEYDRSSKKIVGGTFTLMAPAAIRTPSGQIWVQAQLRQAAARILDRDGHTLENFKLTPTIGFTWRTKPSSGDKLVIVGIDDELMRRRSVWIVAAGLLHIWGLDAGTATADACEKQLSATFAVGRCEGELDWSYDPAAGTFDYGLGDRLLHGR